MVTRRTFIGTLLGGLLAAPLAAGAQQVVKVFRIGWINTASPGWHDGAFQDGLRELGYVEGRNLITVPVKGYDSLGRNGTAAAAVCGGEEFG